MSSILASLASSIAGFSSVDPAHAGVEQRRSCDLGCHRLGRSKDKPVGCGKDVTHRRALPVLSAILILGACASTPTQPLKESDRAAISTVEVSPEVRVVPDAYYFGPNAMAGFLFGAVVGAIAVESNKTPGEELKTFATDNNISVAEIVRTEFIKQLEAKRKFRLMDSNADAVVRLDVYQYGISIPNGFSNRFVPVLSVRSQLVKGNGQVAWFSSGRILPLSDVIEPVTAEAIKANPRVLRDMWSAAARVAVEKMLSGI